MPRICPSCDGEVPQRTTGRPATYCSTACRQAAHRAKARARTAIERAAEARAGAARDIEHALAVLHQARDALAVPLPAGQAGHGRHRRRRW
ncbi:hypothetical protein [Actinoallomurus soli]|uniref:hypothetical protein n=1 Tax=Actinoallomurus soli TaxID=2952535 RepID=UPI0020922C3B|nr:hypothetical protein [Actinoallomurus soli]MCO5974841.1 hypothetical protein [Actinoallomurus soli]